MHECCGDGFLPFATSESHSELSRAGAGEIEPVWGDEQLLCGGADPSRPERERQGADS